MALLKRGNKYSVRYSIPTEYREALGKSQVWRTTGTGCLKEANSRSPRILADIIEDVENQYREITQSSDSPRSPAYLFNAATELLDRDDLTDEQKSDIMHDLRDEFLKVNSSLPKSLTVARSATTLLTSKGRQAPLSVAMQRHLDDLRSRERNESTVERKEMVLTRFKDFTGDPTVPEVDRQMVGQWIEKDLNTTNLKPKTKGWYLSALQSAWTYFILHGMTDTNPFERMVSLVQNSKKGVEEADKPRPWTQDELDKLKALPSSDPIYTISLLRLHSGIRVEEACNLKVTDIDLTELTLTIRAGKTQSSIRTLPLHSTLIPILTELVDNADPEGFLFHLTPGGRDLKRSHNFSKRVGRWIRKHVTKDTALTHYTLRHTYAQALRDLGVDRETIEFTTGHKDQSMLFGTYATQAGLDRLREAVEKLDFGF